MSGDDKVPYWGVGAAESDERFAPDGTPHAGRIAGVNGRRWEEAQGVVGGTDFPDGRMIVRDRSS